MNKDLGRGVILAAILLRYVCTYYVEQIRSRYQLNLKGVCAISRGIKSLARWCGVDLFRWVLWSTLDLGNDSGRDGLRWVFSVFFLSAMMSSKPSAGIADEGAGSDFTAPFPR